MIKLKGVLTPIVTPFTDEDTIDYSALEKLIERQLDAGVDVIAPCGSTGEYYALSKEERCQLIGS